MTGFFFLYTPIRPLETTPLFPRIYTPIPSNLHPYSIDTTPFSPGNYTPIPRNYTPILRKFTPIPQSLHPYSSIPTSLFLKTTSLFLRRREVSLYIWIMNNLPKCLALPKSQSLRIPLSGSRSKFWGLISLNNIQSKSYLSKLTVDMIIIYTRFSGMFNSQWYP